MPELNGNGNGNGLNKKIRIILDRQKDELLSKYKKQGVSEAHVNAAIDLAYTILHEFTRTMSMKLERVEKKQRQLYGGLKWVMTSIITAMLGLIVTLVTRLI